MTPTPPKGNPSPTAPPPREEPEFSDEADIPADDRPSVDALPTPKAAGGEERPPFKPSPPRKAP